MAGPANASRPPATTYSTLVPCSSSTNHPSKSIKAPPTHLRPSQQFQIVQIKPLVPRLSLGSFVHEASTTLPGLDLQALNTTTRLSKLPVVNQSALSEANYAIIRIHQNTQRPGSTSPTYSLILRCLTCCLEHTEHYIGIPRRSNLRPSTSTYPPPLQRSLLSLHSNGLLSRTVPPALGYTRGVSPLPVQDGYQTTAPAPIRCRNIRRHDRRWTRDRNAGYGV
jgi:hypothetical protein